MVAGTLTYAVTFKTATGSGWTVTATYVSGSPSLTANTGAATLVNAGTATKLQVLMPGETAAPGTTTGKTGTPTTQIAGTSLNVTVKAVDANWNLVNTGIQTVAITSSDVNATLPSNAALVAGTLTYAVTFKTATSSGWTVTATYVSGSPSLTANTGAATLVSAGTMTKLVVTLPGQTFTAGTGNANSVTAQTAGSSFNIVSLTATDAYYNIVSSYTGVKTISYAGPGSGLNAPTYTTSITFTNGQSTTALAATLTKAETTTITATDGGSYGNASSSLTVNPGSAYKLIVTLPGQSFTAASGNSGTVSAQTAGSSFNITSITMVDANYNIVTSYTGAKTIAYAGPGIGLSAPTYTTSVTFASGQSTTTLATTLTKAEATTITVGDGTNTGTASSSLTVNPGANSKLIVTLAGETFTATSGNLGTVSAQTAGTAFNISKLTMVDANYNIVTSYTGVKTISYAGPGSGLNAPTYTTSVTFASGQSTTTLATTLTKAETTTITATDGGSYGNASSSLTVNFGALDNFAFVLSGPNCSGSTFSGTNTLTARDANNNIVTSFDASANNVTISASISGSVSGLSGGNKLTSAGDFSSGVANLTSKIIFTSGTTASGTFNATSATGKTGASGSVTINTAGTWTGTTSTDWNIATNWCGGIPTSSTNVVIPSGPTNQPHIGSAGGVCNNITIGGSLTMDGSYNLTVSGNWTDNGTFTASTSTVNFNGSFAQTINVAATFSTLKINNAAGVTLAVAATVTNLTIGDVASNSVFNDGGFQLTSTGTLTLTSGTFRLGSGATATTYPLFATNTIASGATVDFASSASQTIPAVNFGNVINSGNGDRILVSTGTIGISGTITKGSSGIYTITGSTINFNGTGAQTIPAFTYNNLTSSSSGARTLASSGTISVAGTFTPGSNSYTISGSTIQFNGSSQSVPVFSYNNLDLSTATTAITLASGIIGIAGTYTVPGAITQTISGNTINFNGSGSQTIPVFNYNNLTSSSSGARTLASGSIGVAGTFIPGSNSYAITGSTINFNGTGSQTVPAFNYNNLTLSGTRTSANNVTLVSGGTIGVASTFNPSATFGTGGYVITSNTVQFNGASQTVPAFNYNNLDLSTATTAITLASSGTIGIAGTFTVPGAITKTITGSTVQFNGASQTVPAFNYNNIDLSSASTAITLASSGTIGIAGAYTVPGSITKTITGSTVDYNGTIGATAETISSFTYNNLTISGSGNNNKVAGGDITVNGTLNLSSTNYDATHGALAMSTYTLYLGASATTTGTGDVSGIITRTHTFATNVFYTFGNTNQGITFPVVSGQTLPTSMTLRVSIGTAPCWGTSCLDNPLSVTNRKYEFTQIGGSGTKASYRANYLDSELASGVNESFLSLYSYYSPTTVKTEIGWSNYDATNNYISIDNIDLANIPSGGTLGDYQVTIAPTTTTIHVWNGSLSTDWATAGNWTPSGVPTNLIAADIPDHALYTNQPTLSTGAQCMYLILETGGVLNGGTGGLSIIAGPAVSDILTIEPGASFNPGTSTLSLTSYTPTSSYASYSGNISANNFTITSGSSILAAANSYLTVSGTLTIAGTGVFDAATKHNYIEFNSSSAQSIPNPNGSTPGYHNLILSGTGTKTLPATLNIYDGFTNNETGGTVDFGTYVVVFNGNAYGQDINGTAVSGFYDLTLNNSFGLGLTGVDAIVTHTLTLTNGIITTGTNKLILGSNGTCSAGIITGAGAGNYINGNLRRFIPNSTSSIDFTIGDATNYTPVTLVFTGSTSGCGSLDVSTAVVQPGVASGLSQTKYINRKWSITNTGVTGFTSYDPTFTFVSGDEIGTPTYTSLIIRKWNGNAWVTTTTGTQSTLSTQATGVTSFSDFYIGENACVSGTALWLGGTSTDWNTGSNWCLNGVPSSTDNVEIPVGPTNQPHIGAPANCKDLLIDASASLTMDGAYNLSVYGNWTKNGTFTQSTSIVNFIGSGAQTINSATTFSTLKVNNAAGVTLGAAITTSNLTIGDVTSSSIFNDGGYQVTSTGVLSLTSGTFKLGSGATATTYPSFATNTIASGTTVDYGSSSAQTIVAVNYSNLSNTGNGDRTLSSSGTIGITGSFTPGTGNYTIVGSTIDYNGTNISTDETIASFTYNNLTISGSGTNSKKSGGNITVNGVLNLNSANYSATQGALAMVNEYILYMGATATTSGTGDVSGYINRSSFSLNTDYTFGNPYTLINFTVAPLPSSVTVEVYLLGADISWKTNAIRRYYDVTRTGGSSATRLRFNAHYLDSELNGATATNLDFFDIHNPPLGTVHDHGRTDFNSTSTDANATNNWVGFSNVGLVFLGTATVDDHLWTLGTRTAINCTWVGGSPSGATDWDLPGNWEGGVPGSTSDVVIPAGTAYNPLLPNATRIIGTININTGGELDANTGTPTLTINGSTNAWVCNGTLVPGSSTVEFATTAATMAGTTNFNNVTINSGVALTPASGNTMRIAGALSNSGILDATTNNPNTIEYNGATQTVITPNGATTGYSSLILSGSSTKTLPGLTIAGDFTMAGTASTTAGALTIGGNFTLGSGTAFAGAYKHSIGGNFVNNGATFTATGSTFEFNGTSSQTIGGSSSSTFNNLTLNNSTGIGLDINETINGTLTFTIGNLTLNAYDLTLASSASIANSTTSKYVVTNGAGALKQHVLGNATDVDYPIGLASEYLPVSVQLTAGTTANDIKARIGDGLYPTYSSDVPSGTAITSKAVTKTWYVNPDASLSGGTASVKLQWNASDEGSGFARAWSDVGHYTSGAWTYSVGSAASGSNPYTQTLSGISSFSPFGVFGQDIICSFTGTTFCAGTALSVDYVAPDGIWNSGNIFTAQLSNSSGSFGSPVSIGTNTATTSGTISAVIPSGTTEGSGYRIRVVSSDPSGNGENNGADLTIHQQRSISGKYYYYKGGSDIELKDSHVAITLKRLSDDATKGTTSLTSSSGIYTFTGLCPDDYYIKTYSDASTAGSVNGTDAAQVNAWPSNLSSIEKVRFYAGDASMEVNTISLNSTDAFGIMDHFVNGTTLNRTINSGQDWTFWKATDAIAVNSLTNQLYPNVTLTTSGNLAVDMLALCNGDFNMSFTPGSKKAANANLNLVKAYELEADTSEILKLPVRVVEAYKVGAVSIVLNFNSDLTDIKDVVMNDPNNGNFSWAVKGNELRIGWYSTSALKLDAGETLLTLFVKSKVTNAKQEAIQFELAANPLNELADGSYKVIDDAQLSIAALKVSTLPIAKNETTNATINMINYPNPFNDYTIINYTLPYDGKVVLIINNLLGETMMIPVNEMQTKGEHSLKLRTETFKNGMYMATIKLISSNGDLGRTIKIIK